jgi:hypothetical protein
VFARLTDNVTHPQKLWLTDRPIFNHGKFWMTERRMSLAGNLVHRQTDKAKFPYNMEIGISTLEFHTKNLTAVPDCVASTTGFSSIPRALLTSKMTAFTRCVRHDDDTQTATIRNER